MRNSSLYFWCKLFLVLSIALILARVFFLTVVMGGYFDDLARRNVVRKQRLDPVRGIVTDAFYKPLAMNIDYQGRVVRYYPPGELVAPIIGYLGKPDGAELGLCLGCGVEDLVGKSGLEKSYQSDLAGLPGEVMIRGGADGGEEKEIKRVASTPGKNIRSNIDLELQKLSFLAVKNKLVEVGKSGAVVVSTVGGKILTLVSVPSFDPNLFVEGGKRSDFGGDFKDTKSVLSDTVAKPLFNRAVSGEFAPGSVYKLVPAIASLEEGKLSAKTEIVDTGEIRIGEYRFGNWYLDKHGQTEGSINLVKALARSNDIYFYKAGEMLGVDSLVYWSKKLGLGDKTGIDLPGESGGFVPTPYWREKVLGERWYLGNTYHLAIGQGDLMTTPLQINRMTAEVVSGLSCSPVIVGDGICTDQKINPQNIEVVLAGMREACSPGGTGYPLFQFAGKIYCKTGTAQKGSKDTLSNAWMSVVVPRGGDKKDWLVVTVLIEEGGEGSAVAGPVAAEIVTYILDKR